jgi:hypothetical protein
MEDTRASDYARAYARRGWNPVPVGFKTKKPIGSNWQTRVIREADVPKYFNGAPQNVGVILGASSAGLTDIDLDCREAMAIAPHVLPETGAMFGRASKRDSHWLYISKLHEGAHGATIQFRDPLLKGDKAMLLELRIGGRNERGEIRGAQTVMPGSVHESGEDIAWEKDGKPATLVGGELVRLVSQLAAFSLLARHWPPEGARHDAALTLGGFLARVGFKTPYIKCFIEAITRGAGDVEWPDRVIAAEDAAIEYIKGRPTRGFPALKKTFGDLIAKQVAEWLHYGGPDQDGRADSNPVSEDDVKISGEPTPVATVPFVEVRGGELSNLASLGEEILNRAGVQIFQRSRQLVRPVIEGVDATRGRKTRICQLIPVVPDHLRDLLCRHARWQKYDLRSKRYVLIDPPSGIAATILARTGEWQLFPSVYGVTSSPTMRPDGTLVTEPGFDQKTGLLLVEPPPMPQIAEEPMKVDAKAALKLLEDLLVGFPFVDAVARAGALSAIITAVVRGAFPVTPLHASRAPTAGSGKSFLWDIVAGIIIGQPMPVISTGKDEIELEKRLGAALMTGQPLISIDNISGELGGDALCQIIERPVVEIRVLGQSRNMRIEARGTSTYATGNNFTLVGDIYRRVITVNLDAGLERPELRQFEFDPFERVLADRGKYIAAALTICRAYFVAGRPDKAPKLASFEGWSDTVRSALIWLGKEDPVKSMDLARQEDPELVELAEMLEAWSEVMGIGAESRAKLADVLLRADSMSRENENGELTPTYPRLNAALKAVGQRNGKPTLPDARLLGKWLQRFKGRPVGGKKFMNLPDPKHGAQWWVEGPQQPANDAIDDGGKEGKMGNDLFVARADGT